MSCIVIRCPNIQRRDRVILGLIRLGISPAQKSYLSYVVGRMKSHLCIVIDTEYETWWPSIESSFNDVVIELPDYMTAT